jgi:hypothetical protein
MVAQAHAQGIHGRITGFSLEAKASTRPMIMQFPTISGRKTPSDFERPGHRPESEVDIVVNAAMTIKKIVFGRRLE